MDTLGSQIDISKLFLHRKLFLIWILVVFFPFALVIALFSGQSSLMEVIVGTSVPQQSFSSSIADGLEAPAPKSMRSLPVQQKTSISHNSLLHNDGVNTSGMEKNSRIQEIKGVEGKVSETVQPKLKNNTGKSNLFRGKWIRDSRGPLYTNDTCAYIQGHQNCMKNGRPDREYLYWRWKPNGHTLPRFNATSFLDLVRGKVWAFVGDSVARNQMQSLLCMLSQVTHPNNTYNDETYSTAHWYFASYNFTLIVLWSPYLVKYTEAEFKGVPQGVTKVHLDVLDPEWVTSLPNLDAIILTTGQWYLKSGVYIMKDEVVGCHGCQENEAKQLGFYFAFRHAIQAALNGVRLLPGFKGIAFLQTFTVDHFEGQWDAGATCNRTVPYKKGEVKLNGVQKEMHKIVVDEFKNGTKEEAPNGSITKLVDITYSALLRPDGHPGKYRDIDFISKSTSNQPIPNDCLHWCLPGPIDTWNELLLQMIKDNNHFSS